MNHCFPPGGARRLARALVLLIVLGVLHSRAEDPSLWQVGVASVDITPDYPVRLSGYGNRRAESEGVAQRLHAKALAFGGDAEGPALVITVDNVGVPSTIRDEVVRRLAAKTKVTGERVAVCSSHTHCAPMLAGLLPN